MKKLVIMILLSLMCTSAYAVDFSLVWEHDAQSAALTTVYEIERETSPGVWGKILDVPNTPIGVTNAEVINLSAGIHCFRARAKGEGALLSGYSNVACGSFLGAPYNVTITESKITISPK